MSGEFSVEWLQASADAFDVSLVPTDRAVTIGVTVLAGPDGDIPTVWSLTPDRLAARIDPAAQSDLVMTIPWVDALALLRGDVEPSVAYMRGKLKASGDMELLLALLRESESPAYKTWRERVQSVD